jgi:hypothetical protein
LWKSGGSGVEGPGSGVECVGPVAEWPGSRPCFV